MKSILLFLTLCMFSSCKDLFQYHPGEIRLEEHEQNLNFKNIQRLQTHTPGDTLKFIVIGDSQRFYDEVQSFVDNVNQLKNISFVILAGDITDFGLNKEYKWINQRLSSLHVPYIAVVGNHDMLGNGLEVYKKMYGPTDFSFSVGGNKFICLNTNSLEVGNNGTIPNMPWLQNELSTLAHYNNAFVVSHIPPFDPGFDSTLEMNYATALSDTKKVRASIHGHQHSFSFTDPYNKGVGYVVTNSMNKREYTLITVVNNTYDVQQKEF